MKSMCVCVNNGFYAHLDFGFVFVVDSEFDFDLLIVFF